MKRIAGITLCEKPSSSPLESSCALIASLLVVVGEWSANKIARRTFASPALLSHIYYLNTYDNVLLLVLFHDQRCCMNSIVNLRVYLVDSRRSASSFQWHRLLILRDNLFCIVKGWSRMSRVKWYCFSILPLVSTNQVRRSETIS